MLPNILLRINLSEFNAGPIEWFLTPFRTYFGATVWPIIFAVAIAVVYGSTKHIGPTVAAILLVFGFFGTTNYFLQAPEFSIFFSIIAILGFAGTILALFLRKHA